MDGPVDGIKLIRRHKTELQEALTGDPEILLQHCHASEILSNNEYNNIKDTNMRSKQVRDILDYVIHKDNKHALNFLKLLKTQDMQETFPKLHFLQKLQINKRKSLKNTGMIVHSAFVYHQLATINTPRISFFLHMALIMEFFMLVFISRIVIFYCLTVKKYSCITFKKV